MRKPETGKCEHCNQSFGYYLIHSGFNSSSYAYCDRCGMTAILSIYDKRMPKVETASADFGEISAEIEPHLQSCQCGGMFRKGASPRCPKCSVALSPEVASTYIEANAAGIEKGWRWQRNWNQTYCIVIENRSVNDNFKK